MPDHPLVVVGEGVDFRADQVRRAGDVLAQQHRVERLGELVGRADFANLADLRQHVLVVERIERILVLQLGDHQLQKRAQVDVVDRIGRGCC